MNNRMKLTFAYTCDIFDDYDSEFIIILVLRPVYIAKP